MKKGVRKNHQKSPYYSLSKNMVELLDLWCLLLGKSLVYKRSIKIRSIENFWQDCQPASGCKNMQCITEENRHYFFLGLQYPNFQGHQHRH